jgi:membrane protein implicated in regulation of membrane protease activity
MGSELMRWVWLAAGVVLLGAELATAGFVLLPLALGAFAAALVAFVGGAVVAQVAAAAVVAAVSFAALRPVARRMEALAPADGVGARRLANATGVVVELLDGAGNGQVRVDGEQWPAHSHDHSPIATGSRIRVVAVHGAHLVVAPFEAPMDDHDMTDSSRRNGEL